MSTIYSIYLFLLPSTPPVFLPLPLKFMIYYSLIILYNYVYVCIYMIMIHISLYVIYVIYRYIIIYDGLHKLIYVNVWFHWWNCFGVWPCWSMSLGVDFQVSKPHTTHSLLSLPCACRFRCKLPATAPVTMTTCQLPFSPPFWSWTLTFCYHVHQIKNFLLYIVFVIVFGYSLLSGQKKRN